MNHAFKKGDRVVYHASPRAGRRDLDGYVGTVQSVDDTRAPYKVLFDKKISEPMEGNCWHCSEEHLSSYVGDDEDEEDDLMGKPIWNKETDGVLHRMKEEGASASEIAEVLGLTVQQVYNRVNYMKTKKTASRKECDANEAAPPAVTQDGEGKAELNPLEEAMKEQILGLEAEKERMIERIAELESAYKDVSIEKAALAESCEALSEKNKIITERWNAAEEELEAMLEREAEPQPGEVGEGYYDAVAQFWTVYLNTAAPGNRPKEIGALDVCAMMALANMARIADADLSADIFRDTIRCLKSGRRILDGYQANTKNT
jgi:hypothetical protein